MASYLRYLFGVKDDESVPQWMTFLQNFQVHQEPSTLYSYLSSLRGPFLADSIMPNDSQTLKGQWIKFLFSYGINSLDMAIQTCDLLKNSRAKITPWSVMLMVLPKLHSIQTGNESCLDSLLKTQQIQDDKLARSLFFDQVLDLGDFCRSVDHHISYPNKLPGFEILLSEDHVTGRREASVLLFCALLNNILLEKNGNGLGADQWVRIFKRWTTAILKKCLSSNFSDMPPSWSVSARRVIQAFNHVAPAEKASARQFYIEFIMDFVKIYKNWVPGFHPDDALGADFLMQIRQTGAVQADADLQQAACRNMLVEIMRPLFDTSCPHSLHKVSEGVRRAVDEYRLDLWWPSLRPEHAVCVRHPDSLPEHAVYEILGKAGASASEFCLTVEEIARLSADKKILDSRSGRFGSSTRIQLRQSDGVVRPVRMKQALMTYRSDNGSQKLHTEALMDLMMEGWNGLFIVNEVIGANVGLGRHLVRTHHFAVCDSLVDLRIVTDHVENNCGTLSGFVRENSNKAHMMPVLLNLIEQLVMVVFVLNYDWGIFHNDLHWENVLVQKITESREKAAPMVYSLYGGGSYSIRPVEVQGDSYRVVIIDYGRMCQVGGQRPQEKGRCDIGRVSAQRLNWYMNDFSLIKDDRLSDLTQITSFSFTEKHMVPDTFKQAWTNTKKKALSAKNYSPKEVTALRMHAYLDFNLGVIERYANEFFLPLFSERSKYLLKFAQARSLLEKAMRANKLPTTHLHVCNHGFEHLMAPCPRIFTKLRLFRETEGDQSTPSGRALLASVRVKNMFLLLKGFIDNPRDDAADHFCPPPRFQAGLQADKERQTRVGLVLDFYSRWLPHIAAWYARVSTRSNNFVFHDKDVDDIVKVQAMEDSWLLLRCNLESDECNNEAIRRRYQWLASSHAGNAPSAPPMLTRSMVKRSQPNPPKKASDQNVDMDTTDDNSMVDKVAEANMDQHIKIERKFYRLNPIKKK